jgi:hypothetical protein
MIVPIRDDKRYRSWKTSTEPVANAVIVYMMDVSGSMGDEQKEIVRIESFWLDTWLRSQYKGSSRSTSSTTPSRARSTGTRSFTPARAAAR